MASDASVATKAAGAPQEGADAPSASIHLGQLLRDLRRARGWTLAEAGAAAGVARSTLSKVENGQMSPTYDLLIKVANGYGVDLADLFARSSAEAQRAAAGPANPASAGRLAVTRAGTGRLHRAPFYEHEVLATALRHKRMMPFRTVIRPAAPGEALDWSSHGGEEFVYVMKGRVAFHTEHYEPVILEPGDSIYIDSGMAHAAVALDDAPAEVLWVSAF